MGHGPPPNGREVDEEVFLGVLRDAVGALEEGHRFGTGFPGASGSEFGEPMMKAFVRHAHEAADLLREALRQGGR